MINFIQRKNIDYMYNLIDDLLQKQSGKSIKNDMNFFNYYNNKLREIFIESDATDIIGLNKELLSHHIKYYTEKSKNEMTNNIVANNHILNKPKSEIKETIIEKDNNSDVMSQYNDFMKHRDIPFETNNSEKINNTKEISFNDIVENVVDKKPNIETSIIEIPKVEELPKVEKIT